MCDYVSPGPISTHPVMIVPVRRYDDLLATEQEAERLRVIVKDITYVGCFDPGEGGCLGTCVSCKARAALATSQR